MVRNVTLYNMACMLVALMMSMRTTSGTESPSQVGAAGPRYDLPATDEGLPGEGPLRRYEGYANGWRTRRAKWAERREADRGAVVFLGDSITQGWGDDFARRFPGMKAANRGIGGDTSRGMLIRLEEDVLVLDPAAIVILAGTNDVEVGIEPEAIARNLGRIIDSVKRHDETVGRPTPIVLCRVLPSSAAKKRPTEMIRRLNTLIENTVRGDAQVTLLDTWTLFADANGDARPAFFPDLLHLNPAGYDTWAAALRPVLATLGFVDTAPDDFVVEDGFESLFNGSDLTGWGFRPTPPRTPPENPRPDAPVWVEVREAANFDGQKQSSDGRYVVVNGRLVVTTPPEGRRIQQLWTTREFGDDFVLRLQFRATPNADSGVFIRQPQLQCRDFVLAGPWKDLQAYRPQDWNDLEVTVDGAVAKATCNGVPIPGTLNVPPVGPIGLEGDRGQMEYRRIRLKRVAKTAAAAPAARPNVILFIADDVSWDDVGCYASGAGNTAARTPRIDQLAASGRRFDAAILTASSCSPSRSSIITGRYPHNCGRASELHQPIAAHLPWFPRLMREAGYFTALVGKNHMTVDRPQSGASAPPAAFDVVKKGVAAGNRGGHAEWVQTVRERPRDRPFFFWFAALDAHRDWDGDADWREDLYGPRHEHTAGDVPPFLVDDPATRADLASYRNEVTRFDYFVGQVVDELARQEILDDTLLIVMADNGRPFPRAKTRLHDSGMKTPFVVHWPHGIGRPGIPTKSLVSAIDIAPTILAAAGIKAADTMQGVSFLPLLADPEAVVRQAAFSEHNWHDYEAHGRSVRTSDGWLYIRNRRPLLPWQGPADSVRSPAHRALLAARDARRLSPSQADVFLAPRPEEELYYTPDDPNQVTNLTADPTHAVNRDRMQKLLAAWTEQTHDSAPSDLSTDEHDRETGLLLPESGKDRNWFRGTPAGWDRDAAHTMRVGPR